MQVATVLRTQFEVMCGFEFYLKQTKMIFIRLINELTLPAT